MDKFGWFIENCTIPILHLYLLEGEHNFIQGFVYSKQKR